MAVWTSTTSCPASKSDYWNRGLILGCKEKWEYHCLLDQNGVPGEICVQRTFVDADGGCRYIDRSQRTTTGKYFLQTDSAVNTSSNLIPIMPVVLGIVAFIVFITLVAVWMHRRRQPSRNDEECHPRKVDDSHDHENAPLLQLDEYMLKKGEIAIEEHKQDTIYVPTQGVIWTTQAVYTNNVAVISGIVGSGKTKTALHTASTWQQEDEHRHLLLIESINEISDVLQRKLENVIIVMDDCFTRWTLECTAGSLTSMCAELYRRVCQSNNVKLIITIDHNIYQRHKQWLSHIDLFKEHLIITLPIKMAGQVDFVRNRPNMEELLKEERKQILLSYIKHHEQIISLKEIHKIISGKYTDIGFPSVCVMFFRLYKTAELTSDFFQHCDTRILRLLKTLKQTEGERGREKKCILSYAMLRGNSIDLDELDLELLNRLREHYQLEPYDSETVISIVNDMSKTFLIQMKNKMFKIAYTVMYNRLINEWIHKRRHDFLALCSITLIKETIRPDGYRPRRGEVICVVKKAVHITRLAQRFKELLSIHPELKYHRMMSNDDFQREIEKI